MKGVKKKINYKSLLKTSSVLISKDFAFKIGQKRLGRATLGVIIAKKYLKKAVARNRVRRVAKVVFREF